MVPIKITNVSRIRKSVLISLGELEDQTIEKYTNPQTWEQIKCDSIRIGPFWIKSTCRHPKTGTNLSDTNPSKWKVFICGFMNLQDYGRALKDGLLTKDDHILLGVVLQQQMKKAEEFAGKKLKMINHNLEVDILHFKFIETN